MSAAKILMLLVAGLALTACGGTRVKISNQTGQTLTSAVVGAYPTASSQSVQFSNINSGTVSDAANWQDDTFLTVSITSATGTPGGAFSPVTTSVILQAGKTNLLTLTATGQSLTYTSTIE